MDTKTFNAEAAILSVGAGSRGFDDIGDNQATGSIASFRDATGYAGLRFPSKAIVAEAAVHGLKRGQPIVIGGTGTYGGLNRVLHVLSTTAYIINETYSTGATAGRSNLGGLGSWCAFMPLEADVAASQITNLSFHRTNEQSGTQDIDNYTKDKVYFFPGIIKEIQLSTGNLRLFRHAHDLNING